MSDEIHPLSRREGPASSPESGKPIVPLDTSLPDVCTHQKTCFALCVQAQGGMAWLLGGLAFVWAVYTLVSLERALKWVLWACRWVGRLAGLIRRLLSWL